MQRLNKIRRSYAILLAVLGIPLVAYVLWWATLRPLPYKDAYAIALRNAKSACEDDAKKQPGLDCTKLEQTHSHYPSPGPTDGSDEPSWTFTFEGGEGSTLWVYQIFLNSNGKVVYSKGGVESL